MIHWKRCGQWTTGLGLYLLLTAPLSAGVVYEIDVKDHEQSPPGSETIETAVEGRHLKMGIAANSNGKQGEMIFRGERREIVVVDHENKSFFVIDQEMIRQVAGQVNSAMSQMREALKNVPPDKRAMVEQMMKQRMPAQAPTTRPRGELKRTGERAEKSGYPCVKYEVWAGSRKMRELWVTDWDNIEGGDEVVGVFEDMANFYREMMEAVPKMGQGNSDMEDSIFEFMNELGGYPVVTREFGDDGSLEGENTLRSARRQTLDPDAFEPPSGYKRQEMFGPR